MNDRCDHEMAEPARAIDVANFCHYFKPSDEAFVPDQKSRSDQAMDELKALFGDTADDSQTDETPASAADDYDTARKKFDDIFK